MLCRPEPTKEKIELTILNVIAIEIPHSTRYTLLLLAAATNSTLYVASSRRHIGLG